MTSETANQQPGPSVDVLDDVHKRLVRIHQALAEPTNAEVHKVRPWTLDELMALIREVQASREARTSAP